MNLVKIVAMVPQVMPAPFPTPRPGHNGRVSVTHTVEEANALIPRWRGAWPRWPSSSGAVAARLAQGRAGHGATGTGRPRPGDGRGAARGTRVVRGAGGPGAGDLASVVDSPLATGTRRAALLGPRGRSRSTGNITETFYPFDEGFAGRRPWGSSRLSRRPRYSLPAHGPLPIEKRVDGRRRAARVAAGCAGGPGGGAGRARGHGQVGPGPVTVADYGSQAVILGRLPPLSPAMGWWPRRGPPTSGSTPAKPGGPDRRLVGAAWAVRSAWPRCSLDRHRPGGAEVPPPSPGSSTPIDGTKGFLRRDSLRWRWGCCREGRRWRGCSPAPTPGGRPRARGPSRVALLGRARAGSLRRGARTGGGARRSR